jgi:phage shock protein A
MGILSRLAQLIKSNLNDLISRSEDPEKMLEQIMLDMNQQLMEAKTQVAASIAEEKKLQRQAEEQAKLASEWERKATLAVRAGNDELAKEALLRKRELDALAEQFQVQWQKQKQGVDQLKLALQALNRKIEEAKRKKILLVARKKRAEAQKTIQQTLTGLSSSSAFETFDRMASKIDQMEAEAEASAELSEQMSGDLLANKFQTLEATTGADHELLELKRKMGLLPPEPEPAKVTPMRVQTSPQSGELDETEQAELARALAELDAQEPVRAKQ